MCLAPAPLSDCVALPRAVDAFSVHCLSFIPFDALVALLSPARLCSLLLSYVSCLHLSLYVTRVAQALNSARCFRH